MNNIDQFLDISIISKLTQDKIKILNRSIISEEVNNIFFNSPNLGSENWIKNSSDTQRTKSSSSQTFPQKMKRWNICEFFYEADITLIPEPERVKKEIYIPTVSHEYI